MGGARLLGLVLGRLVAGATRVGGMSALGSTC